MRQLTKLIVTLLLTSAVGALGCDHAPADLREWSPDDHDRADEQQKGRKVAAGNPKADSTAQANPTTTLAEVTWRNQCTPCHGMLGHGDGPQGPMVHAPDLTLASWQDKVSDQEIAQTILNGKNRMPKFDFPPEVAMGLVARIRASKGH